jgi:hypothetical protein
MGMDGQELIQIDQTTIQRNDVVDSESQPEVLFIIEFQVQIIVQKIGSVSDTYVVADSKRCCKKVIRNMRHSQGY